MKTKLSIFWIALLAVTGVSAQQEELVDYYPQQKEVKPYSWGEYLVEENRPYSGEVVSYYDDGSIEEEGAIAEGLKDGEWKKFDKKGNLIAIANYNDGKKDGVWKTWDRNGVLRMIMHYKNGARTGVWKSFDENGNLLSEREF